VDIAKLRYYCLNERHPRGRHKAHVFASVLGLTRDDADVLRSALLKAARDNEAMLGDGDDYGQRYVLEFQTSGPSGQARVRSSWIVLTGEDIPRMTSCYVI